MKNIRLINVQEQTNAPVISRREWRKTQTQQDRIKRLRSQFDDLQAKLRISQPEDWYNINWNEGSLKLVRDGIIRWYFGGSPAKALMTLYPEHEFLPWSFKYAKIPLGFWGDTDHQKKYLAWFAKKHNIEHSQDWYQISNAAICNDGGRGLLSLYDHSLCKALNSVFSGQYEWKEWLFTKSPLHFWESLDNQRQFMDYAASKLAIKEPSDWYNIKARQIKNIGGWGLLDNHYGGSLPKLLASVYPQVQWKPWLFDPAPKGLWSSEQTIRDYLKWIADQCGIVHVSDWNYISRDQLKNGKVLLDKTGGLHGLLHHFFPEYDKIKPKALVSKSQHRLYSILKELFDPLQVHLDYVHPKLVHTTVNKHVQFDIYIPELRMAFEYQGEHHYAYHYLYGHPEAQQARDNEKKLLCEQNGIKLIPIPYWWDRCKPSLIATIHKQVPHVLLPPTEAQPIPDSPPQNKYKKKTPQHKTETQAEP